MGRQRDPRNWAVRVCQNPDCGLTFEWRIGEGKGLYHSVKCANVIVNRQLAKREKQSLSTRGLPGHPLTEESKQKIRVKRALQKMTPASEAQRKKLSEVRQAAWAAGKYDGISFHTSEGDARLSESTKLRWAEGRGPAQPKPSMLELSLIPRMEALGFRHTGDGAWWRSYRGITKNPDFKKTGEHVVAELFGRYWHRDDDVEAIKAWWAEQGYECLIFWDDEVDVLEDVLAAQSKVRVMNR